MRCDYKTDLVQFRVAVEVLRQYQMPDMYGVKGAKE